MSRFEVQPFTPELIHDAARLLARRHAGHRQATPALDPAFEQPAAAERLVSELAARDHASGAVALKGDAAIAYVLGAQRVVPASDEVAVKAWFSLGFGQQHVHAVREPPPPAFTPSATHGLLIRRAERRDLPALAELDIVLPRHSARSPVFSRQPIPTVEETLVELEADFDDPRYAVFVAEHDMGVVGTAVGCSLELSGTNTPMMRPRSCGFLGFAAVLPDARGLGAGRALAEAVMAWSRGEGYEWVATDWRSTNVEANRTWAAMGFEPSFHRLHRAIV